MNFETLVQAPILEGGTPWWATVAAAEAVGDDLQTWEALLDHLEQYRALSANRRGRPVRVPHPSGPFAVQIVVITGNGQPALMVALLSLASEVDREGLRGGTS